MTKAMAKKFAMNVAAVVVGVAVAGYAMGAAANVPFVQKLKMGYGG